MVTCLGAACAPRSAPPVTTSPAFPDFMYPGVPGGLGGADDAARVDRGWRFLQGNDLQSADREFADALRRTPGLYPARAASAYVALAAADFDRALGAFDGVLRTAPAYVPALVGRGQVLPRAQARRSSARIVRSGPGCRCIVDGCAAAGGCTGVSAVFRI